MSLIINGSGSITGLTSGAGIAAAALSGQVPDANAPSGSVIQVVQALKTDATSNASGNWADISGLSASITPTSASNKILVVMTLSASSQNGFGMYARILRNGTAIGVGNASGSRTQANAAFYNYSNNTTYSTLLPLVSHVYDTPSTTSAITYKIQAYAYASTIAINYQLIGNDDAAYTPVVSSSITLMEIAA
jgi:hypothetical protein